MKAPTKTCHNIKIRSELPWAEMTYNIEETSGWKDAVCKSKRSYGDSSDYEEECCLVPGEYILNCGTLYGEGWNGGYVEIDGTRYCEDFTSGWRKLVTVNFN